MVARSNVIVGRAVSWGGINAAKPLGYVGVADSFASSSVNHELRDLSSSVWGGINAAKPTGYVGTPASSSACGAASTAMADTWSPTVSHLQRLTMSFGA